MLRYRMDLLCPVCDRAVDCISYFVFLQLPGSPSTSSHFNIRPVLVIQWDPTRPWHPRHSAGQQQVPGLGPHIVGAWSHGTVDPRSWGFSSVPAHEYVVRDSASRLRALRRILAGQEDAVSPIRPTIWASAYGDEHSGIRRLEARWAGRQAAQGQRSTARAARALPGQRSSRPLIRRSLDASLPLQTAAAQGQGASAACPASGA